MSKPRPVTGLAPARPLPRHRVLVVSVLTLALTLPGCVTQTITTITLSGVVRGDTALAGEVPPDAMQLTRNGVAYQVSPDMPLQTGDMLRTGPNTSAVVTFPDGPRVYVYPNSQVRIGSIIDDFGKVFVKVKGVFKVKTTFVTAGSEGTEYWVDVKPDREVKVVVVQDVVTLESPTGAWATQRMQMGQQGIYRSAGPGTISPADPAEIRRETDWVRQMDQRVPVKMTVSPWALMLVPIAIGAMTMGGSDSDRSRGQGSTTTNTGQGTRTGTPSNSSPPAASPAPGPTRRTQGTTTYVPPPAPAPAPTPTPIK
ncbi:MAG: FecR domain-containing protein [Caldimonas sp.]